MAKRKRQDEPPHTGLADIGAATPSSAPQKAADPTLASAGPSITPPAPRVLPARLMVAISYKRGGIVEDRAGYEYGDDEWHTLVNELARQCYGLPDEAQRSLFHREPPLRILFVCSRGLFARREEFSRRAGSALHEIATPAAVLPEYWTVDLDRVQIDPVTNRTVTGVKPVTDAQTGIEDLAGEVLPRDTAVQAQRLEQVIKHAQHHPPTDKERFVEQVNRMLDILQHRIELDDGAQGVLVVNPGSTGKGFIQFRLGGKHRGSRGGFEDAELWVRPRT